MGVLNNYYGDQLEKVFTDTKDKTVRSVKIQSWTKETNWLTLNDESASQLVKYLQEHYNIK